MRAPQPCRLKTFTTLFSFDNADGSTPLSGLAQGGDGDLYGTTYYGGSATEGALGSGTLFKISAAGELTTIYRFCSQTYCADGANPQAGLVLAENGDFYGTTNAGGSASHCFVPTVPGAIAKTAALLGDAPNPRSSALVLIRCFLGAARQKVTRLHIHPFLATDNAAQRPRLLAPLRECSFIARGNAGVDNPDETHYSGGENVLCSYMKSRSIVCRTWLRSRR